MSQLLTVSPSTARNTSGLYENAPAWQTPAARASSGEATPADAARPGVLNRLGEPGVLSRVGGPGVLSRSGEEIAESDASRARPAAATAESNATLTGSAAAIAESRVDELTLSDRARQTAESDAAAQADRLARIRNQITRGEYLTFDKIEVAVERLHDEIVRA